MPGHHYYYYDNNGIKRGPFASAALRLLVNEQTINPRTILETESGQQFLASQLEGLFARSVVQVNDVNLDAFETDFNSPYGTEIIGEVGFPKTESDLSEKKFQPEQIDTGLIDSILVTFFCCFPLGIVSIIISCLASNAVDSGNIDDAKRKAEVVHTLNVVAVILFFLFCPTNKYRI